MSLKIWLPLCDNNNMLKNLGLQPLTWINTGLNIVESGKIGGYSHYAQTAGDGLSAGPITIPVNSQISICAWVNFLDTTRTTGYICGFGNPTATADFMIARHQYTSIGVYLGDSQQLSANASEYNYNMQDWMHVAATYDGTKLKLYVNGQFLKEKEITTTVQSTNYFLIGSRSIATAGNFHNSTYANAEINDVRYYDHCLSAAEVKEIAQGLILHYKLDNGGMNNLLKNSNNFTAADFSCTRSTVPSNGILQVTPTTLAAYAKYITDLDYDFYNNKTYTVSYDMQEIESSDTTYTSAPMRVYCGYTIASRKTAAFSSNYDRYTYKTISTIGSGWHHYSVSFSVPDELNIGKTEALTSGSNLCVEFYRVAQHIPVQIKNIKLEIGNKDTGYTLNPADLNIDPTIIEDSSGYNHNGISSSLQLYSSDTPRYTTSNYITDAATAYLSADNLAFNIRNITTNIWFKSTNTSPTGGHHCPLTLSTNDGNNLTLFVHNSGKYRSGINVNNTSYQVNCENTNCLDGNWHMLTLTYDGATLKRYFDGTLVSTTVVSYTTDLYLTNLVIGKRGIYISENIYISDLRIYATPLLDDDIKQLYNISMGIDKNGNTHTGEYIENQINIFNNKNVSQYCKTNYSNEPILRNGILSIRIYPADYYHNISNSESAILKNEFLPNTQYYFDIWADGDSSTSTNNTGFRINYTDGTDTEMHFIGNGNNGWQHKVLVSDENKSILNCSEFYGTNTPVYYGLNSFIGPISNLQIQKNTQINTTTISENYQQTSFHHGGALNTKQIIER